MATLDVTARLDWNPRYAGTSHEDATARAMGFRGALLPGVFVYGHAMRLAVRQWGLDWLSRGTAQVRFRRPVYAGDALQVQCGDTELDCPVTVRNTVTGEVVLDGTVGIAVHPAPPPDLPVLPTLTPRLVLEPRTVPVGLNLGATEAVLDTALVAQSLAEFHETDTFYADHGLIHSGCLIRKTMGDALGNLVLPMPVIFAGLTVQNLAPAPVGARYRTSAQITRAWEARGKHYFETDEWLLANGHPVARHTRQNIYAMDTP